MNDTKDIDQCNEPTEQSWGAGLRQGLVVGMIVCHVMEQTLPRTMQILFYAFAAMVTLSLLLTLFRSIRGRVQIKKA